MNLVDSKIKVIHLSENETYILPEIVYELSENEILCIKKSFFTSRSVCLVAFEGDYWRDPQKGDLTQIKKKFLLRKVFV